MEQVFDKTSLDGKSVVSLRNKKAKVKYSGDIFEKSEVCSLKNFWNDHIMKESAKFKIQEILFHCQYHSNPFTAFPRTFSCTTV